MEYLKEILQSRYSVPSLEEYMIQWKKEKYIEYIDNILKNEWLKSEKLTWKKEKIWEVLWNEVFVYKVSEKYIENNRAIIYIYIWGNRKYNYRLELSYNLWKMITWDYKENRVFRIEGVILKQNIFIQNKKNKKWYLMENLDFAFKKELDKILPLIIREYLNPYFSCKK